MRRIGLAVALTLVGALALTSGAASKTSKASFDVHVGDNFVPPLAHPSVARAANGDTIQVPLTGAFNKATKAASGGGTFVHMRGTTVLANGTLTLTRTIAFQFCGCGVAPDGSPLPSNFCGGRCFWPRTSSGIRHPIRPRPSSTTRCSR